MSEPRSSAWLSPPGDTIEEFLEERGWTKKEFATRLGCTPKHVSLLLRGDAPIHAELASTLSLVLGSTPDFWLRREANYRAARQRKEEADRLLSEADWLDEIPGSWLVNEGLVPYRAHKGEQVEASLRFFGVGSVSAWRATYESTGVAYRSSASFGTEPGAVAAWLRRAELQALAVASIPWNEVGFREVLPQLRGLTKQADLNVVIPHLTQLCAAKGVVVVVVPAPPGCLASGCTRWLTPERAMLVLGSRYRTQDQLWFTFFHEVGHLLLHSKKQAFVDGLDGLDAALEHEANAFAREALIPARYTDELALLNDEDGIVRFAERIGVHPGVVVGRLQHDGHLPSSTLNGLKVPYETLCISAG